MAISQNFPNTPPSLLLDFAKSKKLDSRITFTRGSTGTYVDDNGLIRTAGINEPRFDHDPNTLKSLGLLMEESRTNLVTYSEQFDNVVWANPDSGNTITGNSTIAPDGTNTADLVSNVGQVVSLVQGQVTVPASSTTDYYVTIYAKKATASYFTFNCYYGGNNEDNVNFNFDTGGVTNVPYPGEYIFQDVGNGWYRCGFRMTRDSTGSRTIIYFRFWESGRTLTSGNTYFWGAQLEGGRFATSYIPTTSSTVTRSLDLASLTGTNFSNWYNPTEGSVLCNARLLKVNSGTGEIYWSIGDSSTFNESIYQANDTTNIGINMIDGGSNQFGVGGSTITDNSFNKTSVAYKLNDSAASFNGSSPTTDTSCTIPTVNIIRIGNASWGIGNSVNGHIAQITYYPRRLSNTYLQELTK